MKNRLLEIARTVQPSMWIQITSLTLTFTLAAAWLVSEWLQITSAMSRMSLWAIMLVIYLASAIGFRKFANRERAAAIRTLRRMRQPDFGEAENITQADSLIEEGLHPDWVAALRPIAERLHDQTDRLLTAEQARAGAEVKAKRLEQEHVTMRHVLDRLSDPLLLIDAYQEVTYANDAAKKLFNISADSSENQAAASLIRCEQLLGQLEETLNHRGGGQRTTELQWDGDWYRLRTMSLENSSGDPAGVAAVLRDINEQKTMQRRNAEFVSAVSHEMKTPLTGIKAYVELLADGDAEDEATQEEFLGVINGQADRLQRLIDNLLNLARIEAGVVEVSKEELSLNEVLEGALGVVAPAAERKSIELVNELSPMFLGVHADRDMLAQAAINLLSNAIKYTPEGGRVTLRSQLDDSDVAFSVEDTGVGLSEEDCQRVFEKFYRVKKDKQMAAGTGLGLPLAKHIVEDVHGGRLEVESRLGFGSTFKITLTELSQVPAMA